MRTNRTRCPNIHCVCCRRTAVAEVMRRAGLWEGLCTTHLREMTERFGRSEMTSRAIPLQWCACGYDAAAERPLWRSPWRSRGKAQMVELKTEAEKVRLSRMSRHGGRVLAALREEMGISTADFSRSGRSDRVITLARRVAVTILCSEFHSTNSCTARVFGFHHTSVMYMLRHPRTEEFDLLVTRVLRRMDSRRAELAPAGTDVELVDGRKFGASATHSGSAAAAPVEVRA